MALDHFLAVRDGRRAPRFVVARSVPAPRDGPDGERHARGMAALREREAGRGAGADDVPAAAGSSLLELKIALAERELDACRLCPHDCGVDRNAGETGFCGVAAAAAVHWEGILYGEELPLLPSHEVFFSGCTLRCAFCCAHEHVTRPMSGRPTAAAELAACAERRRSEGAASLNLVGGEPTVHIPTILRALNMLREPVPVVWNSNMYATPRAMRLLDGVVDLFLGDIHFGNEACARRLGGVPAYLPSVTAAFAAAARSGASVIARHLVMPGHVECCAGPALEWAARALPEAPFHLMLQYVPDYRTLGDPVMGRTLRPEERERCEELAAAAGARLYDERAALPRGGNPFPTAGGGVGETVDLLIHGDGRVSFTRLLGELVPVAEALNGADPRVAARAPGPAGR